MITGSQYLRNRISVAGPARLDRRLAERESAEQNLENWLHQVAVRIRLAISRRIPVGFENETGFHLGVQVAPADERMDWERARIFHDDEHF